MLSSVFYKTVTVKDYRIKKTEVLVLQAVSRDGYCVEFVLKHLLIISPCILVTYLISKSSCFSNVYLFWTPSTLIKLLWSYQ